MRQLQSLFVYRVIDYCHHNAYSNATVAVIVNYDSSMFKVLSTAGMSGISIFVNTVPFVRPGRDEKKIPLPVNTVPSRSLNTVKCLNDRY